VATLLTAPVSQRYISKVHYHTCKHCMKAYWIVNDWTNCFKLQFKHKIISLTVKELACSVFLLKYFSESHRAAQFSRVYTHISCCTILARSGSLQGLLYRFLVDKWLQKPIWRHPASSFNDGLGGTPPFTSTRWRTLKASRINFHWAAITFNVWCNTF